MEDDIKMLRRLAEEESSAHYQSLQWYASERDRRHAEEVYFDAAMRLREAVTGGVMLRVLERLGKAELETWIWRSMAGQKLLAEDLDWHGELFGVRHSTATVTIYVEEQGWWQPKITFHRAWLDDFARLAEELRT